MYYLRSTAAADAIKFTVDTSKLKVCSYFNPKKHKIFSKLQNEENTKTDQSIWMLWCCYFAGQVTENISG